MNFSGKNMNVYTEYMLASLFNVTTTSPFECNLKNPVPVKGRKSYRNAMAVSIRVAEKKQLDLRCRLWCWLTDTIVRYNGECSLIVKKYVFKKP